MEDENKKASEQIDLAKTETSVTVERDAMDGGFAVVDRERLIEEETREITPWYKHFINVFIAPQKMMEENFYNDPPKGMSVGVVGTILFGVMYVMLTLLNPVTKEATLDALRNQGIAEDILNQTYSFSMVGGVIAGIIGLFVGALMVTVVLQIFKLIAKDKGSFGNLFRMTLLAQVVASAILCVDGIVAMLIGVTGPVFSLGTLLGQEVISQSLLLMTLSAMFTLANIWNMVFMVMGYHVVTRASLKKSTIVIVIYELLSFAMTYGILFINQKAMEMLGMMQ